MDTSTAMALAALSGAGLYGAGRITHNVLDSLDSKPKTYGGASADKIVIQLPSAHKKKEESAHDVSKIAMDAWTIPASAAALAAGYYGTNKLHDKLKKDKAESDLNEATAKYHGMLDKIKGTEKLASDTPIVDAMCRVLVEKQAGMGFFPDKIPNIPPVEHAYNWLKEGAKSNVVAPVLGVGATLFAAKFLADRIKRKREEEASKSQRLPTQIIIQQPNNEAVA